MVLDRDSAKWLEIAISQEPSVGTVAQSIGLEDRYV